MYRFMETIEASVLRCWMNIGLVYFVLVNKCLMSWGQNVIPLEENSLQDILNDDFAECLFCKG